MKERDGRNIAIAVLCVAIVAMGVGYALLSSTLTINGSATVAAAKWDVHFVTTPEPTPTLENITGADTTIAVTANEVDVTANFTQPGQSVTYTVDIENGGTLEAKIASMVFSVNGTQVTATNGKAVDAAGIEYSVTGIAVNDTLAAGATDTATIKIDYPSTVSALPTFEVDTENAGQFLDYTSTFSVVTIYEQN